MKELSIIPRAYQQAIFETAKNSNTLVVLPTGLGKTLIALMLSIHRKKLFPLSKILILAPTRPLIEQHFSSFKKMLPELFADLQLFTGSVPAKERRKIFQTAEIIFSTPQCIANDVRKGLYSLAEVSLLVIDEAHRCLKNYDYTKVVASYKSQAQDTLILGLTASPGTDAEKVREICKHLNINEIEVRTRDSPDVKEYLKEREYEKIEVEFPKELIEMRVILKQILNKSLNILQQKGYLPGPVNKISLLKLQTSLALRASQGDGSAMYGMSLTAQALKISHALELLETQTLAGLNEYLSTLLQQASENKSKAVKTLVSYPEFNALRISLAEQLTKNNEHPKIASLVNTLKKEFENNKDAKILVFTQFRDTAQTIKKALAEQIQIKSAIFVGQAKKTSSLGSTGLNQKEQKQVVEKFTSGELNVLIATSIGEEGLDIPEVSAVIFYEPIPSAIRKIQRAGRTARLSKGKLIILITKGTRDEISHYASTAREKKMYKVIEQVKQELKNRTRTLEEFK